VIYLFPLHAKSLNTGTPTCFSVSIYTIGCKDPFKCHKGGVTDWSAQNGDKPGTELTKSDESAGMKGKCICTDVSGGKFYHRSDKKCHQEKVSRNGTVDHGKPCEFDPYTPRPIPDKGKHHKPQPVITTSSAE